MKKVVRTIATVALLLAANITMAKEPVLTAEGNSKSVVLKWDEKIANTALRFVDSKGNVIYADKVKAAQDYIKKFNLKTLDNGNYFLIVEDDTKETTYSIKISEKDVIIVDKDENLKPVFKNEEGRVSLNYLNSNKERVKVTVYDSFGRKLYNETFEDEMYVAKMFNFEKAHDGEYTIVVKDDTDTFYEYVSIK